MTRNPNVTIMTKEQYEEAKRNGINRQTACSRVRDYGWTIERAISEPPRRKVKMEFTTEERKLMRKHQLKEETVYLRIKRYGWDRERALTQPTPYRILH